MIAGYHFNLLQLKRAILGTDVLATQYLGFRTQPAWVAIDALFRLQEAKQLESVKSVAK